MQIGEKNMSRIFEMFKEENMKGSKIVSKREYLQAKVAMPKTEFNKFYYEDDSTHDHITYYLKTYEDFDEKDFDRYILLRIMENKRQSIFDKVFSLIGIFALVAIFLRILGAW